MSRRFGAENRRRPVDETFNDDLEPPKKSSAALFVERRPTIGGR
jgi:hypothetical protein